MNDLDFKPNFRLWVRMQVVGPVWLRVDWRLGLRVRVWSMTHVEDVVRVGVLDGLRNGRRIRDPGRNMVWEAMNS